MNVKIKHLRQDQRYTFYDNNGRDLYLLVVTVLVLPCYSVVYRSHENILRMQMSHDLRLKRIRLYF